MNPGCLLLIIKREQARHPRALDAFRRAVLAKLLGEQGVCPHPVSVGFLHKKNI